MKYIATNQENEQSTNTTMTPKGLLFFTINSSTLTVFVISSKHIQFQCLLSFQIW
jgi:hypothetical protein